MRLTLGAVLVLAAAPCAAQAPANLTAERSAFADWLSHAPVSPRAAVGVTLIGRQSAPVETGARTARRVVERGTVVWLEGDGPARPLPRNRPVRLGSRTVLVSGPPGRSRLWLFGAPVPAPAPDYYAYDPALTFSGPLVAAAAPEAERVLTAEGVEVDATYAGTVTIDLGGTTSLRVLRVPDPAGEESSLEIYFRDGTSGAGSYPAGRFVALEPLADGRYRLDFNRARNPFCAYNANYPCPAPWRGNTIAAPVRAGERYTTHL